MGEARARRRWRGAIAVVAAVAVLVALNGCRNKLVDGDDQGSEIGPAGGIVFYDKGEHTDGWRYLEAWTADETGTFQWKTSDTSTPGTSTNVGSGYANTYSAMTGTEHPAAEVVRNATHGGYNDWFLPSQDELNEIYRQRGVIGDFTSAYYWSSSEFSSDGAWRQFFGGGGQVGGHKSSGLRVRAVRAF